MSITIIGVFLISIFFVLGYFRGLLRIFSALLSLVAGGLLAPILSPFARKFLEDSAYIPKALIPLASLIAAGLAVFLILLVVCEIMLARRQRERREQELPALASWERWGGGILGAAWGFLIAMLVFVGIDLVGRIEQAMSPVPPKEAGEAKSAANQSRLAAWRSELDQTLFSPIVKDLSPVDEKVERVFRNLATVISDPALLEKLQKHPDVAKLANDPRFVAVASDPEIQRQIETQDFYSLLDNPKIAALAENDDIFEALKDVDMDEILKEIVTDKESGYMYITPSS